MKVQSMKIKPWETKDKNLAEPNVAAVMSDFSAGLPLT
jgi:hypothetical protein